jgi:uncharacterized protein YecT (DUF1311 family)
LGHVESVNVFGVRYTGRVLILLCAAALNVAGLKAPAADWPDGYVVYENTESPDGRYGILVPSADAWEQDESLGETNYFANLKRHLLMGKIQDANYFEHQNHAALQVVWAPDSSWCVVEYDGRFGFGAISILEPKDSSFVQTDIGKRIDKTLATAIEKESQDTEDSGGDATTYFRISGDGKLQARAVSTTDPKHLSKGGGYCALFAGTFDLRAKKWLAAKARSISRVEHDGAQQALSDSDIEAEIASMGTEDKLESLDESLNGVYAMLRVILPPARFATVKKEQIEWLKKRDATGSAEEKCKLIAARIKTLQELLW